MFHIPLPSWDDIIEASSGNWPNTKSAATLAAFRTYRYLGFCCQNVAGTPASNDFTTAGTIKARIIHRMGGTGYLSHVFGSRMAVPL